MKLAWTLAIFSLCFIGVNPLPTNSDADLWVSRVSRNRETRFEKRRGGGGHSVGKGHTSGGDSESSNGASKSGATGKESSTSNIGGTTSKGSGTKATYGGGRYYAGGATRPYQAGRPASGITPSLSSAAALDFFPGLWHHPVYVYSFHDQYQYTSNNTNQNTSLGVSCLCEEYQECGCEQNNNSTYYESLFNSTQPRNTSVTSLTMHNGTEKIFINGTLANGTTAAETSVASGPILANFHVSLYWITAVVVLSTIWRI